MGLFLCLRNIFRVLTNFLITNLGIKCSLVCDVTKVGVPETEVVQKWPSYSTVHFSS